MFIMPIDSNAFDFGTFQAIPKNENGRKIAVLADMLELGPSAAQLHKDILKSIDFNKIDKVYLYGEMMKNLGRNFD